MLEYNGAGALPASVAYTVPGAGNGAQATSGELIATAGTTIAGAVNVNGGILSFDNGTTGIFSGAITVGAGGATIGLRDWYALGTVRSGTISGVLSGAGGLSINSGTGSGGVLTLSGANTYGGATTVTKSVLQANDGTGLPAASNLVLDGGTLQSNNAVAGFTRSLGTTGSNTFQTTANGGGFSANGGLFTVNLGGSGATQTFGTTVGTNLVGPLLFGSATANNETLFQNGLNLNGAAQTITVTAGTGGGLRPDLRRHQQFLRHRRRLHQERHRPARPLRRQHLQRRHHALRRHPAVRAGRIRCPRPEPWPRRRGPPWP